MQLFLLLFLLSHVATVTAVAGCHSDRDKDHRPRKNCTAAGFSDVPAGLEPTTKVLLFPRNLFSSLSWSSFQIFTEIYEIDLTGNKVPVVTPSATPILPTLSVLRLGSNRLTSLPDGSFSACPALTELYLDNNNIESLSDHTFSGLSKLEILELSSNRIKVLPELMLHPLPAIETLYLEINKIKVMPDEWFRQKEEVPYLYLSANPWACSCSLGYLHRYINEYDYNIYVRDGLIINNDAESLVCDSPPRLKGKPVLSLEESALCSPSTAPGPDGDDEPLIPNYPYATADDPTTAPPPPPITTVIPAPPPPPITTVIPAPPPPTTTITPVATDPTSPEVILHTELHRVVTWFWHQTFTSVSEWSDHSEAEVRVGGSSVGTPAMALHPPPPAITHSTESPGNVIITVAAKPETPELVPSTVTSTTPKLQVVTTPAPTEATIPQWLNIGAAGSQRHGKIRAVGAARLFCFWLFAACMLLCMLSAACILATLTRLVVWYRRVYKPLSVAQARRRGGGEGVRLVTYSRSDEKEAAGGGVMALYRSVLFIDRERGEDIEREDGGAEGEGGGEGGKEGLLVPLQPTGTGLVKREDAGEGGAREERGVYRKTLYRLLSKEEEIEGWRDVTEECRVSTEDEGKRGGGKDGGMVRERSGGGGGASRKRYSVILREERGDAGGGREELDWVVGGWEVKGGGEEVIGGEHRGSWGEWLATYLPSMPWGVSMPPEGEAAQ